MKKPMRIINFCEKHGYTPFLVEDRDDYWCIKCEGGTDNETQKLHK